MSDPWDPTKKAWRMDPADFRRRATKEFHRPAPRLDHCNPCVCGDRQRDHERLTGRCWVCGNGRGEGCQKFRRPETRPDAAPAL